MFCALADIDIPVALMEVASVEPLQNNRSHVVVSAGGFRCIERADGMWHRGQYVVHVRPGFTYLGGGHFERYTSANPRAVSSRLAQNTVRPVENKAAEIVSEGIFVPLTDDEASTLMQMNSTDIAKCMGIGGKKKQSMRIHPTLPVFSVYQQHTQYAHVGWYSQSHPTYPGCMTDAYLTVFEAPEGLPATLSMHRGGDGLYDMTVRPSLVVDGQEVDLSRTSLKEQLGDWTSQVSPYILHGVLTGSGVCGNNARLKGQQLLFYTAVEAQTNAQLAPSAFLEIAEKLHIPTFPVLQKAAVIHGLGDVYGLIRPKSVLNGKYPPYGVLLASDAPEGDGSFVHVLHINPHFIMSRYDTTTSVDLLVSPPHPRSITRVLRNLPHLAVAHCSDVACPENSEVSAAATTAAAALQFVAEA